MQERLLAFEDEIREAKIPGLIAEFTFRMDDDPLVCYEAVMFESLRQPGLRAARYRWSKRSSWR